MSSTAPAAAAPAATQRNHRGPGPVAAGDEPTATRCTKKWSRSGPVSADIAQSGLKRVLPSYFSRSYHSTRETSDDSLQPPRARARFSKGEETKDLLGENSVQQLNMSWLELGAQSIKINLNSTVTGLSVNAKQLSVLL